MKPRPLFRFALLGVAGYRTAMGSAATLLPLLWLLASPAVAQAEGYTYTTNNGAITITGYTGPGGAVTIPGTINGLPITSIGISAFSGQSSLTSVTIPHSVTGIGDDAFGGCTSLTSVTIPNSITSIGYGAFAFCTSLTVIAVDAINSFYSSVDGVLFDNSQTTLIQFPGGKDGSYTIPISVSSITPLAFSGCTRLTNVIIPNSVTNISDFGFYECSSLTNVTIPNSVTSIGHGAFYECSSLTNVTIPNSVTSIANIAFRGCTSLTSVTIGNSVTRIGALAFFECSSLTRAYFKGTPPILGSFMGSSLGLPDNAIIYYLPGTTGWGPTFADRPTALWVLPYPLILNSGLSFGAQANSFGFIISWATNSSVVVEASTDLASPIWSAVGTNALTGGTSSFSDPQWTNHPTRFYRVVPPVP